MILMGVVNLTPDSFREDTRAMTAAAVRRRVESLLERGCGIIDFGAVSTRPGAASVPVETEWQRLQPAIDLICLDGLLAAAPETGGISSLTAALPADAGSSAPPIENDGPLPLSRGWFPEKSPDFLGEPGWRRSWEGIPPVSQLCCSTPPCASLTVPPLSVPRVAAVSGSVPSVSRTCDQNTPTASLTVPPLSVPRVAAVSWGVPSVSVDTTSAEIVRRVYGRIGRFIVNDISAGEDDPQMLPTVAKLGLPYIAMHKRGNPRSMDSLTDYPQGVVAAVDGYFRDFAARAEELGVSEWILDPGFGFAKSAEQNWELLENLPAFRHFGRPILVGVADKRFTRTPNPFAAEGPASGSAYAERLAGERGADILRIH